MLTPTYLPDLAPDCTDRSIEKIRREGFCRFGALAAKPNIVLWGDSHAYAILPAVEEAIAGKGRAGIFVGNSGCPPIFGIGRRDGKLCAATNEEMQQVLLDADIKTVVLHARWAAYTGDGLQGKGLATDAWPDGAPGGDWQIIKEKMERGIGSLVQRGKHVVLIGPVPELDWDVPKAMAEAMLFGRHFDRRLAVAAFRERQKRMDSVFEKFRDSAGVTLVQPSTKLCDDVDCRVEWEAKPLYRDSNHLSMTGAFYVSSIFSGVL